MMSHEECIEYIQDNELGFHCPTNYYGCFGLKYENGSYYWSVSDPNGDCCNVIPYYLGDALVNYYCENKD